MASLWKHPQSKFFTACFTDRTGKQRKRSTKSTDRKEALKLANQYEEAARKRRTARQAREVIGDLHKEITGEELPSATVRAFCMGWLENKKSATSPATLAFYTKAVSKFLLFLGEGSDGEIGDVTREHLTRFRNEASKSLSPKTVNHDLKCLKMVFKAARRDGAIIEDPTEFVDTVRRGESGAQRRAFTIPELQAVLSVADEEWCSMVRFGLYTGQRLADLASLTWANLDLGRNEIRLETRKTGRRMILPMAAPLRRHIEALSAGDKPDAPIHARAFAVVTKEGKSSTLSNQFGDLLAQAGLREKKTHKKAANGQGRSARREGNALSFHSLRRTATTLLHEAGIPAAVAQELIGHDSEEMHRLYVKVGREAMEKAAASLPEL